MKNKQVIAIIMTVLLSTTSVIPAVASDVSTDSIGGNQQVEEFETPDNEEQGAEEVSGSEQDGQDEASLISGEVEGAQEVELEPEENQKSGINASGAVQEQSYEPQISTMSIGTSFEIGDYTYEVIGDDTVKLIDYNPFSTEGNVVVPSTAEYKGITYKVTTIGQELNGWPNVTSFTLSEGIEVIEEEAICKYSNLTTLNLPSTLREVHAFKWLESLDTITLSETNPNFTLSDGVLYNKDMSTLVLYPAKRGGESFNIPSSVTTLGTYSFSSAQNLTSLDIPDTVVTIEDCAINGSDGLIEATVGNGVTKFGMSNFVDCINLEILTLKGQYIIEQSSIAQCPNLIKVVIDGGIKGYMPYAFTELPKLEEYEVRDDGGLNWNTRDGILFIGNQLSRYPANKSGEVYVVPDDVTEISGMAFDHTQNLNKIILNPGVRLSSVVVYEPISAIDIYMRDTKAVNFINSAVTIFALPEGSHVYVANQKVKDSLMSNAVVINGENGNGYVDIKTIPATEIQVDKQSVTLNAGEKSAVKASLTPYYSTDTVLWESSNNAVATVDASGNITAAKAGTTTITAKAGNSTAKSTVTVKAPLRTISLNKSEITVKKGDKIKLQVNYDPADTTDSKTVTWSSSDKNVASVSNDGTVTAEASGTATITAKVGSYTTTCKINVGTPLIGINLNQDSANLEKGKTLDLKVNYNPSDTTETKTVTWSSSNASIASVSDNGTVTAKSAGTATITAKVGDFTSNCKITVDVPLMGINLNQAAVTLEENKSTELKVNYSPEDTTESKNVTWSSSDKNVASVSKEGTVTAKSAGTVTITAKVGNYTAACKVTVIKKNSNDPKVSGTDTLLVRRGNTYYFKYSLSDGVADLTVPYGRANDQVLIGDWDGDGVDSLCVRRGNTYYFKNNLSSGEADYVVNYGRADDEVLVGDWDGDGTDTLCVRRGNTYYIKNDISDGVADITIPYGRSSDIVLVGDWDGDNVDTLCVRRGSTYYFKNSLLSGEADATIPYGRVTDDIVVGDWDNDGKDTLCVRRGNAYHIKNSISSGAADQVVFYGRANDITYVGTWKK